MVRLWSFFFNGTFRISYYELAKHVGQLRINFGTNFNHIFTGATTSSMHIHLLLYKSSFKNEEVSL